MSPPRETGTALACPGSRELVNLYHGQIRVESEPKSGTAFFLSFQTPEEERAEEEPSPNE